MHRIYEPELIRPFQQSHWVGFDPDTLLADHDNICITDGDNYVLLEYTKPGVYRGHYLYKARGKRALEVSENMRQAIFNDFGVKLLTGLTPLAHLGARWLNKKMGFQSHGVIDTPIGPCEFVSLQRTTL